MRELKVLADYLVLDFPLESSVSFILFLSQCHILDLVTEIDSFFLALAKKQIEYIQNQCATPMLLTLVNRSGITLADGLHGIHIKSGVKCGS